MTNYSTFIENRHHFTVNPFLEKITVEPETLEQGFIRYKFTFKVPSHLINEFMKEFPDAEISNPKEYRCRHCEQLVEDCCCGDIG